MQILLDTLTRVREEQTKISSEEISDQAKSSIAGLKTIIAKKDDKKLNKFSKTKGKFSKDVTLKGAASVSDVKLFERTVGEEDFNKTLVDIQQKTATEAFNVMQMIVKTMTGVYPVSSHSFRE